MIRFIDITTGNVFNGSKPYVFWFDKEQSVNLIYIRKICVLSTDEHLTVYLPSNNVFCLLDVAKMGEDIEMAGKKFKDLDNSGFKTFEVDSVGARYENFYVHMLYVLGRSSDAGEFREDLTIGDEVFTIGADFYNEREELSINLVNQGFEIPKAVEKAIYEFNVHEEGIDNILLNRKYKELLSEYINIIGNKGSYKSLINSLNWFEYGDLVRMLDYWKHEEPTRTILSSHELSQLVDKDIEDIMTKFHKTTYIGLYLALTRVAQDADGNISYVDSVKYWDDEVNKQWGETWESATTQKLLMDPEEIIIGDPKDRLLQIGEDNILVDNYPQNGFSPVKPEQGSNWKLLDGYFNDQGKVICREIPEPVPSIDFAASKWSVIDLSLKMTLLGNFFSTYFMPLHLDLIHSTVENIVFTNTIKMFSWTCLHRQDWNHDIESFSCDVEEKDYYISNVQSRVYPDTTFGEQYEEGVKSIDIFGVEEKDKEVYISVISVNNNNYDRTPDNDRIWMGSPYYAWNEYFTLSDHPKAHDSVYEYNIISGFMDFVGYVESVVESGGWNFDGKEDELKTYLSQRFEGPGAIIPFNCTLHHVQHGMYITDASIVVYHDGESQLHHTYNIHNDPDEVNAKPEYILISDNRTLQRNTDNDVEVDGIQYCAWNDLYTISDAPQTEDHMYKLEGERMALVDYDVIKSIYKGDRHINFNILLQDIGDYQFTVDFKCGNGMHYIRTFKFSVYDDTQQEVKMYKIIRRDWDELKNIIPADKEDLIKFMFTQLDDNDSIYRQFIATSDQSFLKKLGLNQIIIYEPQIDFANETLTYFFNFGGRILNDRNNIETFVDELNNSYPKYRFFVQERWGIKVNTIINDPVLGDNELVTKYKNSKNIAYLYELLNNLDDPTDVANYVMIIPYIFGICLQPDTNTKMIICKDKQVGVVKGNKQDIVHFSLTLNPDNGYITFDSDITNDSARVYALRVTRQETAWSEFGRTLPSNTIIDDHIHLKFEFKNTGLTKEVDIEVPRLVNLSYKVASSEYNTYKKEYIKDDYIDKTGSFHEVSGYYGLFVNKGKVNDYDITNINNGNGVGRLYLQHKFIPVFHHIEEVPDRTISQNDVVCFLPDLNMVKNDKYQIVGWTFRDATTHERIKPSSYKRKDLYWDWDEKTMGPKPNKKDQLVDPLEPMLGRYDLKKIINPGYYDVELEYDLINDHTKAHTYKSKSMFIVSK